MNQRWYETLEWQPAGIHTYTDTISVSFSALMRHVLATSDKSLANCGEAGNISRSPKDLLEELTTVTGCRVVLHQKNTGPENEHKGDYLLVGDASCLSITFPTDAARAVFRLLSADPAVVKAVEEFGKKNLAEDDPNQGPVFVLTQGSSGFQLTRLGTAGKPLIDANYEDKVLDDVAYVRKELVATTPRGRLTVLEGPPGTGKTWLIKSLITTPGATFVMIPANMLDQITTPAFMPALITARNDANGPLVLVLEDGDHALVPRGPDNMSAVSSLLNLGDGIIGSILDIRLVLSTNAKASQMDEAARRPGRLCRHIHVSPLSARKASIRLAQLLGREPPPLDDKKEYTIAEVYEMAFEGGWQPVQKPQGPRSRAIGFSHDKPAEAPAMAKADR